MIVTVFKNSYENVYRNSLKKKSFKKKENNQNLYLTLDYNLKIICITDNINIIKRKERETFINIQLFLEPMA